MKKIYFVRHGETNFNVQGLCNGKVGDIFLTDKGIQQSYELGEKLKNIKFDLIITSGLPRVTETLKNMYSGILPSHEVDSRIKEINTGFDGRPIKEYLDFIKNSPV